MNKAQQAKFARRLDRIIQKIDHTGRPALMVKYRTNADGAVLWIADWVRNVDTKKSGLLTGMLWFVDDHYSDEGVVRLIYRACEAFEIHELREHFLYKGKKTFNPHKRFIA